MRIWHFADIGRMPPGILLSFLLHIALIVWLAIALAFHTPPQVKEDANDLAITILPPPPPPPPPPVQAKQPLFVPAPMPRLLGVQTSVPDLPLPATFEIRHAAPPAVVAPQPTIVVQPRVVSRTNPAYPDRALDNNIQGYVDIEGTVTPDGSFSAGTIIAEVPQGYGLAAALLKVIPKWKFEPRTVNGVAVPYRIRYRFTFALTR